ncbi:MAG: CehA/McbA family metallohydrolase [Actinomycetota bacterium]
MGHTRVRLGSLRVCIALVALVAGMAVPSGARATGDPAPSPYTPFVGAMHEHSGYSDGYPGSTPGTYYASAKGHDLDFLMSGEHSDNMDVPVALNDECLDPTKTATCPGGGEEPQKALRKWDSTLAYARAASDASFTGVRGFEWTSDRYGHINVYFSRNYANAKTDGGYAATMRTFYEWFALHPQLGGGEDGLAVFNHPGAKKLQVVGPYDPDVNWEDFAYVPAADDRMVGIELFNDDRDYDAYYSYALDKGWHLGAVGAEDLGHQRIDDWGGPQWAKTVILATDRGEGALYEAMLARRFYAVRTSDVRMTYTLDDELMGARLVRPEDAPLHIEASVNDAAATLEVVTSGGEVVESGISTLDVSILASGAQGYYYVRARNAAGKPIAYSSPVWVSAAPGAAVGQWLAGDLHVHTCFSHDSYCPPDDDNTGPDTAYALSGTVAERFLEASARGLDYLAITDHNDIRSHTDPGFGTQGVIGVRGYENSLNGHGQMLGVDRIYDSGDGSASAVAQMAAALRAAGGAFQANHPTAGLVGEFSCDEPENLHWTYGYDVPVDTVEVWNGPWVLQPPAGSPNEDAVRYWECWLQRGAHVGATGGSDSHALVTAAVQGVGNPTTWVFARARSERGVVDALREGRTSIAIHPPMYGAPRLVLEADVDGDGNYESMIGDTVPPGTKMRVRADGLGFAGEVEVRAGTVGAGIETPVDDAPLAPGGSIEFNAPSLTAGSSGWVRATLRLPDGVAQRRENCNSLRPENTTYCRDHILVTALTSPIYVG